MVGRSCGSSVERCVRLPYGACPKACLKEQQRSLSCKMGISISLTLFILASLFPVRYRPVEIHRIYASMFWKEIQLGNCKIYLSIRMKDDSTSSMKSVCMLLTWNNVK